jgi:dGTPase
MKLKTYRNALAAKAFVTEKSRGRRDRKKLDRSDAGYYDVLDPYRLDAKKIRNSKGFRRLGTKTQVYSLPDNPHVRTRLIHTAEVIATAVTIAEILGLNIPLIEAIAIGHDIGHTPYGHLGERFVSKMAGKPFHHSVFGVVVAQHIERKGLGLNLTFETLDGILRHSRGKEALIVDPTLPLEYAVVMYADKITYTFSDFNDATRYGYLDRDRHKADRELWEALGHDQRSRTMNCVKALVKESAGKGAVSFSDSETAGRYERLRTWMYRKIYGEVNWKIQETILEQAYEFFSKNPFFEGCHPAIPLALLTDREVDLIGDILRASKRLDIDGIRNFGIMEIIPHLRWKEIDPFDPDLGWGEKSGVKTAEKTKKD